MPELIIDGLVIAYSVRRSRRARRARVVSRPLDGLEVVLPVRAPARLAAELLELNAAWVLREQARYAPPRTLCDGSVISLRGAEHRLQLRPGRERVVVRPGLLDVAVPDLDGSAVQATLERWCRRQARSDLVFEVFRAERAIGVRHSRLTVRDQRTRWGSCSTAGTLSFSWRLVLAPPPVLRYVAVHEVAHLAEPNHQPPFWSLVERLLPDWRDSRAWLRAYGHTLRI